MVDLKNVKDSCNNMEVNNVAFILPQHNLTDRFTEINTNITLMTALRFTTLSHHIQKWIIRPKVNDKKLLATIRLIRLGMLEKWKIFDEQNLLPTNFRNTLKFDSKQLVNLNTI